MPGGGRAIEEEGEEEVVAVSGIRTVNKDEEGKKRVEKLEEAGPLKNLGGYIQKKMLDKGLLRLDRQSPVSRVPPKSGHGGKYTWEGPGDVVESELDPVPPAIDPRDPNYDEDEDNVDVDAQPNDAAAAEVEEVPVAKVAEAVEARNLKEEGKVNLL